MRFHIRYGGFLALSLVSCSHKAVTSPSVPAAAPVAASSASASAQPPVPPPSPPQTASTPAPESPTPATSGSAEIDCKNDPRALENAPSQQVIHQLLRERKAGFPNTRFVHTVFPNSPTPRIREEQHAFGHCTMFYLGAYPDLNTCEGPKASLREATDLPANCCNARDCENSAAFYFLAFVDVLSLRQPAAIKQHIGPTGSIDLAGYPYSTGETIQLNKSLTDAAFRKALEKAPGWVGTNQTDCTFPDDENHIQCWFLSGEVTYSVFLERTLPNPRWYPTRVEGRTATRIAP